MPRLSRKLRICKWAGTMGCVLIVGAFVLSGWWWVIFAWVTKDNAWDVDLAYGGVLLECQERWSVDTYSGWFVFPLEESGKLKASLTEPPSIEPVWLGN